MTKLRSLIMLFVLTCLLHGIAHAQCTATNLSGNINTVFSNGSVLLADTNGGSGILYTPDDGVNWGGADAGMAHILISEPRKILP